MNLLVLGSGCAKCAKLYELTEQAAKELGVPYEINKVTDLQQILALRVMMTPALVVNGTVKLAGRLPSLDELKTILKQAEAS
ncbi:MAG: TM0996/MTH895 family glutaredoxin-like protein [Verrucomicrobia bacterium]|nr:TM0996/MTH895 family glutaredoxin-like protein [Verrucomicrobiota bacterium]